MLRDGGGETVSGMVIMLKGENGKRVIDRVKARLASIRLPPGVSIKSFYDQSSVIDQTIATVKRNLIEGSPGDRGAVLLPAEISGGADRSLGDSAVDAGGFIGMRLFGVWANLMSLGAIDFGLIVDGAVVMMENSVRRPTGHAQHGTASQSTKSAEASSKWPGPSVSACHHHRGLSADLSRSKASREDVPADGDYRVFGAVRRSACRSRLSRRPSCPTARGPEGQHHEERWFARAARSLHAQR